MPLTRPKQPETHAGVQRYPRANPARWWRTRSVGRAHRSPHGMFVSPLRKTLSAIILITLILLIAGVWYLLNPKRISALAEILLSHVLDGRVTVQTGHLSLAGTLRLSGVALHTGPGLGQTNTLFSADQVEVSFNWLGLLTGRLHASRIMAIKARANLINNLDLHHWNYEALLKNRAAAAAQSQPAATGAAPLPHLRRLPVIVLRHAAVQWGQITHGRYTRIGESVVNGRLAPLLGTPRTYGFSVEQVGSEASSPILSGSWSLLTHSFTARVKHVELTASLRRALPLFAQKLWDRLHVTGSLNDLSFHVDPVNGVKLLTHLDRVALQITSPSKRLGPQVIAINDLSGSVMVSRSLLQIRNLSGQVMGFGFVVSAADIHGLHEGAPFDVHLALPHLVIPATYPPILHTRAFRVAEGIISRLRPSGLMNVSIHIQRPSQGTTPIVAGEIHCLNVHARYVHFPYPMRKVHGLVTFSNRRIRFVSVDGLAETFPFSLRGYVTIDQDNGPVSLTVSSTHAAFDRRLADCLPTGIKGVWDKFRPRGWGRFVCHVTRIAGSTHAPKIHVHIWPMDVSGAYVDLPYPLKHVHGELYFTAHKTDIIKLISPQGPHGSITFTGTVTYSPDNLADMKPDIHLLAVDVPLTPVLTQSLPSSYGRWVQLLHPTGTVGLDAYITRGAGGQPDIAGSLSMTNGTLSPPQLPFALTHVALAAMLTPDSLTLSSLDAAAGSADSTGRTGHIHVQGVLKQTTAHGVSITASGSWNHVNLTGGLPSQLPASWLKAIKTWRPSGQVAGSFNVDLAVDTHVMTGGVTMHLNRLTVNLQPHNMTLEHKGLPAPIRNIYGSILIHRKAVAFTALRGNAGNIGFDVSGSYNLKSKAVIAAGSASAPSISSRWPNMLPHKLQRLLGAIQPQAAWAVNLKSLAYHKIGTKSDLSLALQSRFTNLTLAKTAKLSMQSAVVNLRGDFRSDQPQPDIAGDFVFQAVHLYGQQVDSLSGKLMTSLSKHSLSIDDIAGKIAGGTFAGHIRLGLDGSHHYHAVLLLNHAELAELLHGAAPATTQPAQATTTRPALQPTTRTTQPHLHTPTPAPPPAAQVSTGHVTASLDLTGNWGDGDKRQGNGIMLVRHANIYNVPLAMGLLQVATLRLPISYAFKSAKIAYKINNDTVSFSDIELDSPGVNLLGGGSMSIKHKTLDLHFSTHSAQGNNIPVLSQIMGLIRSQLLQLRVTGTLSHPKLSVAPLAIFDWLTHPGRK